jgi:hypothetical protein
MEFAEILDLIDATLETDERLSGSERAQDGDGRVWSRNRQVVHIRRSGSTGIALSLTSGDRLLHERVFAQSPQSVERIARVITEHLTEYVQL